MAAAVSVSLVALVSFVFGCALVVALGLGFVSYLGSSPRRMGQFLAGLVNNLGNQGMSDLMVRTLDGGWARVTPSDLAVALSEEIDDGDDDREPPEGGLGC